MLYRSGDSDTAVQRLTEAMKTHSEGRGPVEDWIFLAMVHERVGYPEDARQWLSKATSLLPAPAAADATPPAWCRAASLQILQSEAEALLVRGR